MFLIQFSTALEKTRISTLDEDFHITIILAAAQNSQYQSSFWQHEIGMKSGTFNSENHCLFTKK